MAWENERWEEGGVGARRLDRRCVGHRPCGRIFRLDGRYRMGLRLLRRLGRLAGSTERAGRHLCPSARAAVSPPTLPATQDTFGPQSLEWVVGAPRTMSRKAAKDGGDAVSRRQMEVKKPSTKPNMRETRLRGDVYFRHTVQRVRINENLCDSVPSSLASASLHGQTGSLAAGPGPSPCPFLHRIIIILSGG